MALPLYIFDLDGTLALIEHRRHHVEGDKKDWTAFYKACVNDPPCTAVLQLAQELHLAGNEVWVWSGRSDEVRDETIEWLTYHLQRVDWVPPVLRMRPAGDYTPDDRLKMAWYDDLPAHDRDRLVMTFDDRDRMVAAWRARGVTCAQVAPGDF